MEIKTSERTGVFLLTFCSTVGDTVSNNPLVNFLLQYYEKVYLICNGSYEFAKKFYYGQNRVIIYNNNDNFNLELLKTSNDIIDNRKKGICYYFSRYLNVDKKYIFNINDNEIIDNWYHFYMNIGLKKNIMLEYFNMIRNYQEENKICNEIYEKFNIKKGEKFVIYGDYTFSATQYGSTGFAINAMNLNEYIKNKKIHEINKYKIINIHYLVDFPGLLIPLFENAEEIHLVENSTALLFCFLYYKKMFVTKKPIYFHNYFRCRWLTEHFRDLYISKMTNWVVLEKLNIPSIDCYFERRPQIKINLLTNKVINNFIPLSNTSILKDTYHLWLNNYNKSAKNIIDLDPNIIYIIGTHHFNNHNHNICELINIIQIFLNDFQYISLNNKTFKIISTKDDFSSCLMSKILSFFNLDNKIHFVDRNNFYQGNFLYIKHLSGIPEMLDSVNPSLPRNELTIFLKLIEESNKKYWSLPYFDKLWISSRKIYKGNHFNNTKITNIDNFSTILIKNGFNEMFFENDIFYQIYLISKATIIFGECETDLCNIVFAKEGSKILTIHNPCVSDNSKLVKQLCNNLNCKYYEYTHTVSDNENKKYISEGFNILFKIENINIFEDWIHSVNI